MFHSLLFWLALALLLGAYPGLNLAVRRRTKSLRRESSFHPAFDASTIAGRLQRVRQDHLAARYYRAPDAAYRKGLVAAARRLVAGMPYFRSQTPEEEPLAHHGQPWL